MRRDVERCRSDICQVVTAQLDERRILHCAALFIELLVLPLDTGVGVRSLLQELLGQLESRDIARGNRRSVRGVADTGSSIRSGLTKPGQSVKRGSSRVRSVRIGAVIQQEGRKLEVRIDDG